MRRQLYLASGLLFVAVNVPAAVPNAADKVIPVTVGSAAPVFVAKEVDGHEFRFDPAAQTKPTMIIFYRGGWCPYCNAQLQDLHEVEPEIVSMGYQVLFLSTDQPKLLYSSLKEKVNYHILSDADMNAAHAFQVAYHVDDTTLEKMKSFGVDLDAAQGSSLHELPVPSVFIIDTHGVIRFRHFDPNYTVRLDAGHVLEAAKANLPHPH